MTRVGSRFIGGKQATAYFKAMRYDRDYAKRMNLSITLNFSYTDSDQSDASYAMQRLISDRFSRWFRYQSKKALRLGKEPFGPATYTWVAEAKSGRHFHWCVYMPDELRSAFEERLPKWIADVVGPITDVDGCINIKQVYAVMGLARYCMKGINPIQAGRRHVRPEEQGIVYGKRVAISRSLGKKARQKMQEAAVSSPAMKQAA